MSEVCGSDGLAKQFVGEFEIHLTICPGTGGSSEEPIQLWAGRHGIKYTRIVLDRGQTPDQPMLTCWGGGTLAEQLVTARQWVQRLRDVGFQLERVKIEAALGNADVPETDAEAAALSADCYFEHHVKLVLRDKDQVAAVREVVVPHAAHVSRNALRMLGEGEHERFVTQRCRGVGRAEAGRRLDALRHALAEQGYAVVEVEREFVVYDDNPAADAGWIEGERRLT